MFDEFLRNSTMEDEVKPSKKRVKKNIAAVNSLINMEEGYMTKRRFRLKPLIIAAVIIILSAVSLLTVNAATQGEWVRFFLRGEEIEGEYYDYIDEDGNRQISFSAVLPIDAENFAVIYDVDAPLGENVRVITDETDPDFMEKLRLYKDADFNVGEAARKAALQPGEARITQYTPPDLEDFGLVFKDSEICTYQLYIEENSEYYSQILDGKFMHTGAAEGKPSGFERSYSHYDRENGTRTFKVKFYYYVGKE